EDAASALPVDDEGTERGPLEPDGDVEATAAEPLAREALDDAREVHELTRAAHADVEEPMVHGPDLDRDLPARVGDGWSASSSAGEQRLADAEARHAAHGASCGVIARRSRPDVAARSRTIEPSITTIRACASRRRARARA